MGVYRQWQSFMAHGGINGGSMKDYLIEKAVYTDCWLKVSSFWLICNEPYTHYIDIEVWHE
jgi:hypothetical protein